ncbi:MAG: hypothetical protein WBJ84_04330 [Bacteroidales bacterium]
MDDYIYIILFIGWIAYSIFMAAQKKKQEQLKKQSAPLPPPIPETTIDESPQRSVFEEIFKDFYDEDPEEVIVPEPFMVKVERKPPDISYNPDSDFDIKETTYTTEESILQKPSGLNEGYAIESKNKRKEDFDLRKAVIYNAILQRPYN